MINYIIKSSFDLESLTIIPRKNWGKTGSFGNFSLGGRWRPLQRLANPIFGSPLFNKVREPQRLQAIPPIGRHIWQRNHG